jgi:hypothetical protein
VTATPAATITAAETTDVASFAGDHTGIPLLIIGGTP